MGSHGSAECQNFLENRRRRWRGAPKLLVAMVCRRQITNTTRLDDFVVAAGLHSVIVKVKEPEQPIFNVMLKTNANGEQFWEDGSTLPPWKPVDDTWRLPLAHSKLKTPTPQQPYELVVH